MPVPVPARTRRLTAGLALVALPMVAAVGCGTSSGTSGAAASASSSSPQEALQTASDHLGDSGSASFVMRFDDADGKLEKGLTTDGELTGEQADLLLGGTISVTLDPAEGKTLRDAQATDPALPVAEQLKLMNFAMSVSADGGEVVQLRLVGGDLYANVSLSKITDLARQGGSSTDVGAELDQLRTEAPAELQTLIGDVVAGKWIKLPLAQFAGQLDELGKAGGAPTADPQLGKDLLAAVQPFLTLTDASNEGDERVLDVKVQAKQALKAVIDTVKRMNPAAAGLDTADLDQIGEGTVDGQVFLADGHLDKMTVDLGSAARLAPPTTNPVPDLGGTTLTVDVDDSADEVAVPSDVSSADVSALVQQALSGLSGSGTGLNS